MTVTRPMSSTVQMTMTEPVPRLPRHKGFPVEEVHKALDAGDSGVGFLHHHKDQVVDLHRGHKAHNKHHEKGGGDHGQGDLEELLHLGGAVNLRRLVVAFGDVLKTGEEQHRVVADVRPDGYHGAGDHHPLGIGKPADIGAEDLVEDAVLAVEDPAPHHGDGGGGADHGQEEDGAEEAPALDFGVEEHRHQEGNEHPQWHGEDAEVDGVPGGLPELRAGEDV